VAVSRRLSLAVVAAALTAGAFATAAPASQLIARDAVGVKLAVDARGRQ
jgi:hypothetical protein